MRPKSGLGALTVSRQKKQVISTVKTSAKAEAETEMPGEDPEGPAIHH